MGRTFRPFVIPEHDEQAVVVEWLLRVAIVDEPLIHPLVFSTPNGTKLAGDENQRKGQARKLKEEGAVSGVPDLLCLIPRQGYHYLGVEMKRSDRINETERGVLTGGVSENQREFLAAIESAGGYTAVCYSASEAIDVFRWYLDIKADL